MEVGRVTKRERNTGDSGKKQTGDEIGRLV